MTDTNAPGHHAIPLAAAPDALIRAAEAVIEHAEAMELALDATTTTTEVA
jgi:hypothetical protein